MRSGRLRNEGSGRVLMLMMMMQVLVGSVLGGRGGGGGAVKSGFIGIVAGVAGVCIITGIWATQSCQVRQGCAVTVTWQPADFLLRAAVARTFFHGINEQ